jgi:hypothetical protein
VRRYVYVWADGVYLQARMEEAAECMLVLIGATSEGKKELVGFPTGVRERVRRAGVSSLSTSSSVGSRLRLRGKSRGSFIGYRNSQPLTVFPSVSTSLAETSSTEKLTATMVASLPIRKLASLASLTSRCLAIQGPRLRLHAQDPRFGHTHAPQQAV